MDIVRPFRNLPIAVTPAVAITFPGIAACAILQQECTKLHFGIHFQAISGKIRHAGLDRFYREQTSAIGKIHQIATDRKIKL